MVNRINFSFEETTTDITEPVTKFGGQPVWIDGAQWPISRSLGTPMRFIGQIAIDDSVVPGAGDKVAYLFMTEDDDNFADDTWVADGGENALIIQPNGTPAVEVRDLATGPTARKFEEVQGTSKLQPREVIYAVHTAPGVDPDFIDEEASEEMTDDAWSLHAAALAGNKIGGTPGFLQFDEFPDEETDWTLLLQLDETETPFYLNFGGSGCGYAFVNPGASVGKFLWQ